jgi:hypothetical protein
MNRILAAALALATLVPAVALAGPRIKVATAEKIARQQIEKQTGQKAVYLENLGTRRNVRKMSWAGSLNNNGKQPYGWGTIKIDLRKNKGEPKGDKRVVSFKPGIQTSNRW